MAEDWFTPQDILSQVVIRPFEREDQEQVRQLIMSGLSEHWGWLDPYKNPDLDDIATFYARGIFLVAVYEDEIVGTGALLPGNGGEARIVRMHVIEHHRSSGVGTLIVKTLCEHAQALGYTRVILETTDTWEDAIAFYEANGFHITHHKDGDVYMAKQLAPDPEALQGPPPE